MSKRLVVLIHLIILPAVLPAKDYTDYHKAIIKAERQIFISNQVDSGLNTYLNVFKEFDFVFLHDCMTAVYVALEYNKEKAFLAFMDKATQNGLLKRFYPEKYKLKRHPLYEKNKARIEELYIINRQHYLNRLDTVALKKLYVQYEYDQSQKNGLAALNGFEPSSQYRRRYGPIIRDIVIDLKAMIAQKGWLSDKLAGIDQEDIFKEMKLRGLDLMDYYNKYKETNECVMGAYDINEWACASTLIMPMLIHHNSQQGYGNLYDTNFYRKQIALGNMHPKDFAYINDEWNFSGKSETFRVSIYFGITGGGKPLDSPRDAPDEIINKNRSRYFIAPIETDKAKWKFMKEHGWPYQYGYHGCRA